MPSESSVAGSGSLEHLLPPATGSFSIAAQHQPITSRPPWQKRMTELAKQSQRWCQVLGESRPVLRVCICKLMECIQAMPWGCDANKSQQKAQHDHVSTLGRQRHAQSSC